MLSEPLVEAPLLNVANGYSQGVGSVAGPRCLRKPELDSYHLLNLLFIALPVAGYLLFYLGWRIVVDGQSLVRGC
jgi:hypothetical protein